MGFQALQAASLPSPGHKLADSYENKTLLNATTTAGNASRHATSTAVQIGGAKKVLFQFSGNGSTTRPVDFFVYVSPFASIPDTQSPSAEDGAYTRFTDLVATNGASPTTADTYYARVGSVTLTDVNTSTAAMDLSYGTWRSAFCVASTTWHVRSTCSILIEF